MIWEHRDQFDYRVDELHPDVLSLFEKAREDRHKSICTSMIDTAIYLQENRSVYTACNYIRYLLFHELTWIDVFGEQAKRYDKELEHYQQCIDMELKIDDLQQTVSAMSEQMGQMQIMMMNMAKLLSKNKEYAARTA